MSDCCANPKANGGYDLAVIGAGSAGFAAAIAAAEKGASVALIGHGAIGGTCVNVGCVPSKTLIRAAESLHQASAAARFAGIAAEARLTDWPALIAQKDDLVSGLRKAKYLDLLPLYNNISYREGKARLAEGGVLVGAELLAAAKIVIAAGARPAEPPIPGMADVPYLTSTTAMAIGKLPASLIVIGGGYIGCELAQMFARASVAVTILCRRDLLPEAEPEIGAALKIFFANEGIEVRSGVSYKRIRRSAHGVALDIGRQGLPETLEASSVLAATGRTPNTEGLGLDAAGIACNTQGGIQVDDRMRTTRAGAYAAGDVTGADQFVYMAAYGARIAALNALDGDTRRYENSAMPAVVFTDPQVASVGLTEKDAQAKGFAVQTSLLRLDRLPRALAARDTRGLIKLVAERDTLKLLGAHILAPEGADSIQTAALALRYGMTATELAETIFPYLTTVEGLKLAAQGFTRDIDKLSCCA